jgi:hypothetical protein
MNGSDYIHIDRGKAAFDKLDGEVIIVDVHTGLYFNLQGSAVAIWEAIECGMTFDGLRTSIAASYDGDPAAIAAAVDEMVATFTAAGILVSQPEPPTITRAAEPPGERIAFTPPVVERFDDVQDLLTLDPIHDVAEFGWPRPKDPPANP